MSTTISTRTSHRIAAGVTAAYLRDLSPHRRRRRATGRKATVSGHRIVAAGLRHDPRGGDPRGRQIVVIVTDSTPRRPEHGLSMKRPSEATSASANRRSSATACSRWSTRAA